jgi:hypothetical protein
MSILCPGSFMSDTAKQIALSLLKTAEPGLDALVWLGVGHARKGQLRIALLGNDLLSGAAGAAILFAGLYTLTNEEQWRISYLRAIRGPIKELSECVQTGNLLWRQDFDLYTGLSGIVLALALGTQLTGLNDCWGELDTFLQNAQTQIYSAKSDYGIIDLVYAAQWANAAQDAWPGLAQAGASAAIALLATDGGSFNSRVCPLSISTLRDRATWLLHLPTSTKPDIDSAPQLAHSRADQSRPQGRRILGQGTLLHKMSFHRLLEELDDLVGSSADSRQDELAALLSEVERRWVEKDLLERQGIPRGRYPSVVLGSGAIAWTILRASWRALPSLRFPGIPRCIWR